MENKKMEMAREHGSPYGKLLLMVVLSFGAMYMLMYSMVDVWENVIPNINQLYMAALMTAAMVIIELGIMWGMYPDKKRNTGLMIIGVVVLFASYFGIRQQTAVSDKDFLKSMIPHHAGAILMSKKAPSANPEIRELQAKIIESQRAEIAEMKAKLAELDK